MLLCRGKGCQYRRVCSRYVIGSAMKRFAGAADTWIDRCLNAKKFIRIGTAGDGDCPRREGGECV